MCGGCCQVLLKLALPHLGCVCPCSRTHKRQWQTVAAVTWRKHRAQSATHRTNLCRLQRCYPASVWATAKHTIKKELFQKKEKKKEIKNKLEMFCLQAALGFSSHPKKLVCCFCNLLLLSTYTNLGISCLF